MRMALLVYPAVTAAASSLLFWTVESSSAAHKKQDKQELFPLWRTQENSLLNSQKIIDGENAEIGRYPWNALLRGDSVCGGSLIARDLVVTAAHCGENVRRAEINLYDTTVDEPDARGRPIDSYHPHPNFNVEGPNYDIMIVKLRRPFENAIYEPIKLNFDSNIPTNTGDPLRMLGYGSTTTPEEGLQRATFLQEAPTQYMPLDDCSALFPADEAKPHWLCTLQTEPERYAFCFGDSGGPIFIKGNSPTEDILVGVISAGEGCANPVKPDVSQRISFHEDWIKTTGCELSEMPPDYWNCRSESTPSPDTGAPVPSTPTPDPTNPDLPPILAPTNPTTPPSPTMPPAAEPTMPPKKGPSPTSKSKLYSSSKSAKASKASSNIMSKSTQTFKTSKSIRGTTVATSSSKKEKKEKSSEKKQSKLKDSEEIEEGDSEEIEEEEDEEMGKSKKQKQKKKKSLASKKKTKLSMESEDDSISMDSEDNIPMSPDSEDVAPTNAPTKGNSKSKDSDEANTKISKDSKNSNRRGRRYRRRLANSLSSTTATTMNFTRQKKASKRSSDIQSIVVPELGWQ